MAGLLAVPMAGCGKAVAPEGSGSAPAQQATKKADVQEDPGDIMKKGY